MATPNEELLDCPLCPFQDHDSYVLQLHVEHVHFSADVSSALENETHTALELISTEDRIVGKSTEAATVDDASGYVPCPEDDCGEQILWEQLQEHLDFHFAEGLSLEDSGSETDHFRIRSQSTTAFLADTTPSQRQGLARTAGARRGGLFKGNQQSSIVQRLGTKQLGPYAFEERMPDTLMERLSKRPGRLIFQGINGNGGLYRTVTIANQVPELVPLLGELLLADETFKRAWLCHPATQHIYKLPNEGGFCGYRNMQMLMSYVLGTGDEPYGQLREVTDIICSKGSTSKKNCELDVPGIIDLQDLIEQAWNMGINTFGRVETGGVKGTRKYIGTCEVDAVFNLLGIPTVTAYLTDCGYAADLRRSSRSVVLPISEKPRKFSPAHELLLDTVQQYFVMSSRYVDEQLSQPDNKVMHTTLPPLYLQHWGHSLTIIGFEIAVNGDRNLLVFDPGYKPSPAVQKLLDENRHNSPRATRANAPPYVIRRQTSASVDFSFHCVADDENDPVPSTGRIVTTAKQAKRLLIAYRRGEKQLSKFSEFEVLALTSGLGHGHYNVDTEVIVKAETKRKRESSDDEGDI